MAHITKFIIIHDDGHSESIVGNPMPNKQSILREMRRLISEEGYAASELQFVQVPI